MAIHKLALNEYLCLIDIFLSDLVGNIIGCNKNGAAREQHNDIYSYSLNLSYNCLTTTIPKTTIQIQVYFNDHISKSLLA
jgi:hypothetical protein